MGGRLDLDGPPGVGAGNGVQGAYSYCPFAAHGLFTLRTAFEQARHSRCGNQRLESRMRENRPYGSEGGEGPHPFPTPIKELKRPTQNESV